MMTLLYGENTYSSRQKLNQKIKNFKEQDPSNMNLIVLDGVGLDLVKVKTNILAAPFMGDKRLVILENVLSQKKESLKDELLELFRKGISASSELVFWEEKEFDKRKKLAKYIFKNSQTEEFKYLNGLQLNDWIKKETKNRGGAISNNAVNKLASYVGSDLWQMSREIEKLIIYKNQAEITDSDVDILVKARLDTNIFNFIDAIGAKNKGRALKLLHDQLESGENIQYLLSMINYQFRNLLILKELLNSGMNQYELAKEVKMHPFVIKKTSQQCAKYQLEYLKIIYQKILDLDAAIKTGRIDPVLGLDMLIIALCS